MKKIIILLFSLASLSYFGQFGINKDNPNSTLDVVGKATSTTDADGILLPRISGDQLKAKDVLYSTDQTGAIVYVTSAVTASSTKTTYVTESGYFYFDGIYWQKMNVSSYNALFKDGSGISLNGTLVKPTLISAITSSNSLTFQSPNTTDAYLTVQAAVNGGQSGGIFLGNKNHGFTRGFPTLGADNNLGLFTSNGNVFLSSKGKTIGEFILTYANSFVGLGTLQPDSRLTLLGDGSASDDISVSSSNSDLPTRTSTIYYFRSRGSSGAETKIQSGDKIGDLMFLANDGSNDIQTASINAILDDNSTITTNSVPLDIIFKTGTNINQFPAENLRISNNGNVKVGTGIATENLEVSGALNIGSNYTSFTINNNATNPIPSGGAGTLIFQNSHLFGWTGSSWKQLDNN